MAQNITWPDGTQYVNVPYIDLPKTGGGTARFDDCSVVTAEASDVASGKIFVASDGTVTTGTSSGGGGSNWTLLGSAELTISTTSTSAGSAGTISCGAGAFTADDIIYVRVRDKAGKRAGYFYGSDAIFCNANKANGSTSTFSTPAVSALRYSTSSQFAAYTGQYGVYGYSISSSGTVTIRRRYNSTYSLTIDGTYVVEVYKLTLPGAEKVFK